jgi:hypothetical protein
MNKLSIHCKVFAALLIILAGCKKDPDPASSSNNSSSKSISFFAFTKINNPLLMDDVTGTILADTISLVVPVGTNITSLRPTITFIGKNLDPDTSTSKHFSSPVIYTVTANDNSKKSYTVKVKIAPTDEKSILSFDFLQSDNPSLDDDVKGTISGTNILITVPFGTNVTNLVPTIAYAGASISPMSKSSQNFTSPAKYTVKATDNSNVNYIVTVKIAKQTPKIKDIYLVGSEYTGANHRAKYWKNGVATYLSNSSSIVANDIYVQNNDVHVVGTGTSTLPNRNYAVYWKNGNMVNLEQGSFSNAESIQVVGNDVYIAGRNNDMAVYWKNGQIVGFLSNKISWAEGIQVVGNDVYVAGTIYDNMQSKNIGVYWKNGVQVTVPNASSISAIHVVGNDVYVAGYIYNGVAYYVNYWKNGVQRYLSASDAYGADALSIKVVDNDIHVVGYVGTTATYWKNGQATTIASGGVSAKDAAATSVIVLGDDVHISGYSIAKAIYWKNGVSTEFNPGNANSMFITTY